MAELTGVAYDNVRWQAIDGQPFGNGVGYNGIFFGNLDNIVDVEGPIAVRGNANSYRGMSISFGRMGERTIPYNAQNVRYLVGGAVGINGALTVVGNVLTAGDAFQVGSGSTYLIGKDGSEQQRRTLSQLYAANGSPYWEPADHGDYFIISSYDTPRRIPAARVNANVAGFFTEMRAGFSKWQSDFAAMTANGQTTQADYGYILTGTDPKQNVYDFTWPASGSITGNLALNAPAGSINIVRIYGGENMDISTPLWGNEAMTTKTIFVLMNAKNARLTFPSVIYGSVYAPDTYWNALTTGGSINGNGAFAGLRVQEGSGFELHWYPFEGGIAISRAEQPEQPAPPSCPACPECPACPAPTVCPECPACPAPTVCPECPACPAPTVCPECPACPAPTVCPECPACPAPTVCPECPACPPCQECMVTPGLLTGCIIPCGQCLWRVKLCDACTRKVLSVWQHCGMDCFSFEVNATGTYALEVECCCHYEMCLKNVGVRALSVRG